MTDRNFFPVRLGRYAAMPSRYVRLPIGSPTRPLVIDLVPDSDGEPTPHVKIFGGDYTITWDALDQIADIYGLAKSDTYSGHDLDTFINTIEEAATCTVRAIAHRSSMEIFAASMDYAAPSPVDIIDAITDAIGGDVFVWDEQREGTEWSIIICDNPDETITRAMRITARHGYDYAFRSYPGRLYTPTGTFYSRNISRKYSSLSTLSIRDDWFNIPIRFDGNAARAAHTPKFGTSTPEELKLTEADEASATPNEFLQLVDAMAERDERMRSADIIELAYIHYVHMLDERL